MELFKRGDEGIAVGGHVWIGFFRVGGEGLALENGDDVGDEERGEVDGGGFGDEINKDSEGDAGNLFFDGGAEDGGDGGDDVVGTRSRC